MRVLYYDFYGKPARLSLDEADTPQRCEVYDPATGDLAVRNELTLDVYGAAGSHLISEAEFASLLARVRARRER